MLISYVENICHYLCISTPGSYFEGGIKSAAFIWTPWLTDEQRGKRSPALLHAVDVYSLILAAADDKLSGLNSLLKLVR